MFKKVFHDKLDNYQKYGFNEIIRKIEPFEYVSFDIFDTLLKRDVSEPQDVFSLVEKRLNIKGFKKIRINAEQTARKISSTKEVTLSEIYKYVDSFNNEQKSMIMSAEIKTELALVTINKDIIPLYEYCIKNKKVVLISDMYLNKSVIEQMLKMNKIIGYQDLFISSEVGKTKAEGILYSFVLNKLGINKKKIIHIGNSFLADFISAKKNGYAVIKIATYVNRMNRKYNGMLCTDKEKKNLLYAFINNHTPCISKEVSKYTKFGFECFGPLLYGFITWLYKDMRKNNIEQVFFMARDGYIMQKVYRRLKYETSIPDFYFEASRRSLRVPTYNRSMKFEDILSELTVPNKTDISQIFDSIGLDINQYRELIKKSGISLKEHIKRDTLKDNKKLKNIFDNVYDDIMSNAEKERINLKKYLTQFDFSKKTAIVDIGWGGSMQKHLLKTLKNLEIKCDIIGYYIGLTEKSKENLGQNGYMAKGYIFDQLNKNSCVDMERPFVGLFETLFLEQDGSVKRYVSYDNGISVERYLYEYRGINGIEDEAVFVNEIQTGALQFIDEFKNSINRKFVGYSSKLMFSGIYQTGICPNMEDIKLFGKFRFFNNGSKVFLAKPQNFLHYIIKPKDLIKDLFDSQWKIGFLKGLLKIKLPYLKMFNILRKISN